MDILIDEAVRFYFLLFFTGICGGIFIGGLGHAVKSVIHVFDTSAK